MPLPPFPVAPAPRTWSPGDKITTALLNADPGNAALLLANRPLLVASQSTTGQSLPNAANTLITLDTEYIDNWNGHVLPGTTYAAPLAGWYLAEGDLEVGPYSANSNSISVGIQSTQNSVVTQNDGGRIIGNAVNNTGVTCADLVQMNPATTDTIGLYGAPNGQASTIAAARGGAKLKTEWVGLPTSLPSGNGVVVASPVAAAMWPPGSGTTITNSGGIAAGATSLTVADTTGMVIGGSLGLDWLNGAQAAAVAETVTITSIAGLTVGISATSYSHAQTAPVAVPVSAAFLNQQVRDLIRFLAYPPLLNVDTNGTSASLASQTFPAGTAITFLRANLDNFSGWAGSTYTIPVAGVYFVFGQVYLKSAASYTACAGLAVNGGTTQWGTTTSNPSATGRTMSATVRRHLRFGKGDTLQLFGSQGSGSSIALQGGSGTFCKLIAVWRGF